MESSDRIAGHVTRLAAGAPRRTRAEDARSLVYPVAVSTALHGLAALLIAILVAGGGAAAPPFPTSTIRATLTTAAPQFVVAEPEPAPPRAPESVRAAAEPAESSLPLKPRAAPRNPWTPQGQVTINVLAATEAADPSLETTVRTGYPRIVRAETEFEVPPTGFYPKAALSDKRQFQINVAIVVHEDGRVELAQGTFDDTLFAPAIRAALATAKARPLRVNGEARTSWSLVSFTFEFVGER